MPVRVRVGIGPAAAIVGAVAVAIVYGGLAVLSLSPMVAMTADATLFASIG